MMTLQFIKHEKNAGDQGYLFMATKHGTVKKTPLGDYANIRTNGLIAIKLDDGDELRWIKKTDGKSDVIISTSAKAAADVIEKKRAQRDELSVTVERLSAQIADLA